MATALEMKPEEWRKFNPAGKRAASLAQDGPLKERREKALDVAKQASSLLKRRFGAERVVLFGSLVSRGSFTPWSDIDLAVWGIAPDDFYYAVAAVTGLSPDFKVDLLEPATCGKRIHEVIQQHGIEI
jgi:predicted nucleotidyltransferase